MLRRGQRDAESSGDALLAVREQQPVSITGVVVQMRPDAQGYRDSHPKAELLKPGFRCSEGSGSKTGSKMPIPPTSDVSNSTGTGHPSKLHFRGSGPVVLRKSMGWRLFVNGVFPPDQLSSFEAKSECNVILLCGC
jgi:hypothetical protein